MPALALFFVALLLGCAPQAPAAPSTSSVMPDTALTLFAFDDADGPRWRIENDGVMGGRSKGAVEISDETLVFTGTVVTQGGGFTSTFATADVDLSGYDGIEMRVRGGGRTFELNVDDGSMLRGRSVSRRGTFPTTDEWQTVRVPFASLQTTVHGEPVQVDPVDLASVEVLGIYIIDGQDGPFRLEVDWIRAYQESTS